MPKNEFEPIGEAIRNMLNAYRLTPKFDSTVVTESWERLVGVQIAKRTRKIYLKDAVLFVQFDSASISHDFSMYKSNVLDIFQKEFGKGVVREIVVM